MRKLTSLLAAFVLSWGLLFAGAPVNTRVQPVNSSTAVTLSVDPTRGNTFQSGGNTTTAVLDASASAVDDFYDGLTIDIAGTCTPKGYSGIITDYTGSSKTVTVSPAMSAAPDPNCTFTIGAMLPRTAQGMIIGGCSGTCYLSMGSGDATNAQLRFTLTGGQTLSFGYFKNVPSVSIVSSSATDSAGIMWW